MLAVGVCLLLSIDIEVKVVDSLRAPQLDCNVDARHRVESLRLRLTTAATQNKNDTCAWTPNKVFMRLGSLSTWAWVPGLSASACRRALRAKRPSTMTVLGTGPVLIH